MIFTTLVVERLKRLRTTTLISFVPGDRFSLVWKRPEEPGTILRSSLMTTVVPEAVLPSRVTGETVTASLVGLFISNGGGVMTARY